ncbi:MAG: DUF192 domain-containing protein [Dehalococcoidia bacterium]|nr:DUF192 domain-containing protein [Dehalococcoidia bacterium]
MKPVTIKSGDLELFVQAEVASTESERSQGLMCRLTVPPGTGMLFVFDQPTAGGFWMFNTYAPIDLLYIDGTGRVVSALTMKPCPRNRGEDSEPWPTRCRANALEYRPSSVYSAAIELPAGWLASNGIPTPFNMETLTITWQ